MAKNIFIFSLFFLYLTSFFTVFLSYFFSDYSNLLKIMSKENGFFESLSVIFLLAISIIGTIYSIKQKNKLKIINILIALFSILTFIAAMEEISWGQHIFHFQSGEFFKLNNYQNETNLHNLIDSNLFSSIIYSTVYTVYVFLPLAILLFKDKSSFLEKISFYLPSLHIVLIILFASTFQIYFYNDIGVITDFITLLAGIILFIFVLSVKKLWDKYLFIHLTFIIFSMCIFMYSHSIFSFFNMQYEIRETFVIFATLIYFIDFLKKIRL